MFHLPTALAGLKFHRVSLKNRAQPVWETPVLASPLLGRLSSHFVPNLLTRSFWSPARVRSPP
jgi:hypothetical protein